MEGVGHRGNLLSPLAIIRCLVRDILRTKETLLRLLVTPILPHYLFSTAAGTRLRRCGPHLCLRISKQITHMATQPTLVIDMLVTTTIRVIAPIGWERMTAEQLREYARQHLQGVEEHKLREGIEELEAVPDQVSLEHEANDDLDIRYTSPAFAAFSLGGINDEPLPVSHPH